MKTLHPMLPQSWNMWLAACRRGEAHRENLGFHLWALRLSMLRYPSLDAFAADYSAVTKG